MRRFERMKCKRIDFEESCKLITKFLKIYEVGGFGEDFPDETSIGSEISTNFAFF